MNKNISSSLAATSQHEAELQIVAAKGSILVDSEGKEYIDLISGVCVNNFGHQHPEIVRSIRTQAEKFAHVMVYGEYLLEPTVLAANELTSILPESLNTCYFVNSGTEANEAAIKLCKRHTGRNRIIAVRGAYHGSTNGSLSISDHESRKSAFRPLLPDVHFIDWNDEKDLLKIDEQCAGVFLETIQGDAGVRIPDASWLKALRQKCSDVGALLVFDEIQCGIGRTGKYFAFEHFDLKPDVLTLGKALGGGMPIGALLASKEILDDFRRDPILGHITTFGGNAVVCAAALAVLKLLQKPGLLEGVQEKGKWMKEQLVHPKIKGVRAIGMMLAVDLEREADVDHLIQSCMKNGISLFRFLSRPQSFRIAPALNIDEELLAEAFAKLKAALDELK
ncbi:aspartate aminotransferase family protein [Salibacteraceae bacterium]|jgi:acetylornithine/succinyldiaminopimelate/putrescine aminotransferase|nr:aspartate aminotransferase family protein [Salibacteraceae bacterium]